MSDSFLEESSEILLDFSRMQKIASSGASVIPVAVQHIDNSEVLLVAFVNEEALKESLRLKVAVFWSISRNELWVKGKTSGDFLDLVEVRVNCEQNSLLYLVRPRTGSVCHTRNQSGKHRQTCYYRRIEQESLKFLEP